MNRLNLTAHEDGTFTAVLDVQLGALTHAIVTARLPLEGSNLPVLQLQAQVAEQAARDLEAFARSLRSLGGATPGA